MSNFKERVWRETKRVPRGKVVTYAYLARAIGRPRAVRAVGNTLNRNPYREVPCHRVVRSDWKVGGFARGRETKIKLLKSEGVKIIKGKVNLAVYGFK